MFVINTPDLQKKIYKRSTSHGFMFRVQHSRLDSAEKQQKVGKECKVTSYNIQPPTESVPSLFRKNRFL